MTCELVSYDASGDVTAEGNRIAKGQINSFTCDMTQNGFSPNRETDFVLGQSGEQVTEIANEDGQATVAHINAWAGGKLLGTYDLQGALHFYFTDPLGSRRAQTDAYGALEYTCYSLPFGNGESCQPTPTEHLFTQHERDAETWNDYFEARYFASSMGRFLSPDPLLAMNVGGDMSNPSMPQNIDQSNNTSFQSFVQNPQNWNLYTYALNSPLIDSDPTGLECVWDDGSYDSKGDPVTGGWPWSQA